MKKIIYSLVLGLLVVGQLFAGTDKKNGTAGATELLLPVGARMIGLNGSAISTVAGIEALYYNPAGVSGLTKNTEITFFKGDQIGDIGMNYFAGAVSFGDIGVFSFGLRTLDFGEIPVTTVDQPDGTGAMYSPSFIITTVGYSNALTDRIRVGFSLNLISEKIIRTEATGFALDAGLQYNNLGNINGLSFAIVMKNLGPRMKYVGPDLLIKGIENNSNRGQQFFGKDAAAFEIPALFQIGVSYETSLDDVNKLSASGLFEQNNVTTDNFRGSLEYSFSDMFFLRGSYLMNQGVESENNLFGTSFGGGVNYDFGFFVLGVDYAYRSSQYFGGLHNIGVTFGL